MESVTSSHHPRCDLPHNSTIQTFTGYYHVLSSQPDTCWISLSDEAGNLSLNPVVFVVLLADYLYSSIVVFKGHPRLLFCVSRQTTVLVLTPDFCSVYQLSLQATVLVLTSHHPRRSSEYLARLLFCGNHPGRSSPSIIPGICPVCITPDFCSDVSLRTCSGIA